MDNNVIEATPIDESSIILVEQLPIIKQQLNDIKILFAEKTALAQKMECTEDNLKSVRAARAEITKIFNALEEKRKEAKKAILAPYEDFERVYKECVTDIYKPCNEELGQKISDVENALKAQKREIAQNYFDEYAKSLEIDFVKLDNIALSIGLTTSKKSMMIAIKAYLDKVKDDLYLIVTQEHSTEILVEYKRCLNVSQAITTVVNRHKAIEEEQKRREETAASNALSEEAVKNVLDVAEAASFKPPVEEPIAPPAADTETTKVYKATFTVTTDSIEKLRELKKFLEDGGYIYEQG